MVSQQAGDRESRQRSNSRQTRCASAYLLNTGCHYQK
jgi:hypothetical protein